MRSIETLSFCCYRAMSNVGSHQSPAERCARAGDSAFCLQVRWKIFLMPSGSDFGLDVFIMVKSKIEIITKLYFLDIILTKKPIVTSRSEFRMSSIFLIVKIINNWCVTSFSGYE